MVRDRWAELDTYFTRKGNTPKRVIGAAARAEEEGGGGVDEGFDAEAWADLAQAAEVNPISRTAA